MENSCIGPRQNMRQDGFTKAEKIILTIINPLYVFQNGYH